jgi:hypothetical protein
MKFQGVELKSKAAIELSKKYERASKKSELDRVNDLFVSEIQARQKQLKPSIWKK